MAHLAFIAPPFLGHLNPMLALARELVRRGHTATFLGMADMARLIDDDVIGFRAVGDDSHPAGHLDRVTARMTRIDGILGLPGIIRDVADATAMLVRDLPAALRSIRADAIVCDGTEAAGGLVAARLDLPFVTVANALPLNREPSVPPAFTGWAYDGSRWGLERNAGGYRVSDYLMRRHGAVIADAAERWQLGPRRTIADCLSPLAQVSQTVAGLDFPRAELPDIFHHVGPIREPGPTRVPDPGPASDGRPLAFASLGTLQGGRVRLFRRIAEAADRLGLRLVIAHGGRLTERQVRSLRGSPAAHAFVPQAEMLAAADVAFLNGGLNTVMDALAQGVPIVVVPIAFEQAAIAARLERAGAGRAVSRRFLTAGRLARATADLLGRQSYKQAAARLQAEIRQAGGLSHAADIVEAVVTSGRRVDRAAARELKATRMSGRSAPRHEGDQAA